jgi:acyl-CoA thioesterase-2
VGRPTFFGGGPRRGTNLVWFRVPCRLDDDLDRHLHLLTYMSDMTLLDNVVLPHGRSGPLGPLMVASIDHALWFHRRARVDDWLLYVQDSPAAAGARGFARGTIFARDGTLVASVAQEGLVRPVHRAEDRSE